MKRFTKIISLVICLSVIAVAMCGINANAAPSKYDYAYFGDGFDYSYSIGDDIEVPIMLSCTGVGSQTFDITVYNNATGEAMVKHSENFPATVGVVEYNFRFNTKGWVQSDYYIEVSNMQDSSVLGSDIKGFELYDGLNKYIYHDRWSDPVPNNISKPHNVYEGLEIPYGSSYVDFYVQRIQTGFPAQANANDGRDSDEFIVAPAGKQWIFVELYLYNYDDNTKNVNVKDFITSYALVDKAGKAINVYSYGNIDPIYDVADYCWNGTIEPGDGAYIYLPALIDASVGIPYLKMNTPAGATYIDLNPTRVVTLKQNATDKNWYAYVNGKYDKDYYGVAELSGNLYYVNGGKVDFTYSGIVGDEDANYVIKKGQVDKSFTGFYVDEYDYNYGYFVNGVNDGSFNGIVEYDGKFVLVTYGSYDGYEYGVYPWNGTWWFINGGEIDYSYEGFEWANGATCYIKNGQISKSTNGLVYDTDHSEYYENTYYYVVNGLVDREYEGLVPHAGGYYYVRNGCWRPYSEAMTCYGGTWYAVTDGRPDFKFTGVREYYHEDIDEYRTYYFENGKINWNKTGLVYDKDREEFWYVCKGQVNYDYEGLVPHAGGYYYVRNGRWQEYTDTMTCYGGTWYAVTDGRPDFTFTGVRAYERRALNSAGDAFEYTVEYYFFYNGKIDWNASGIRWMPYQNVDKYGGEKGTYIYLKNGRVQDTYTGLVNHAGYWWYIDGGILDKSETLVYFNGTWYYSNHGYVDFKCNTLVKYDGVWYYARNGAVDWNADTLIQYGNAWYAVKKGTVNWGYTGLYNYANKWFYVQNGSINWNAETLVKYGSTYYYVKGGQVNWNAETLVKGADGAWYYVKNGAVDFNCDTLVQYKGTWYYVKGGVVDWKANKTVTFKGNQYKVVNGQVVFG